MPTLSWFYQYYATVISSDGNYLVKTCQGYPDSIELDASWKASRAFIILAFIFALMIIVIKTCVLCSTDPDGARRGNGRVYPLYLVLALFQGLSLLFLDSKVCKNNPLVDWGTDVIWPDTCSLSTGANCIISATIFWICAGLCSFQELKALEEERNEVEPVSLTQPPALTEPLNPDEETAL